MELVDIIRWVDKMYTLDAIEIREPKTAGGYKFEYSDYTCALASQMLRLDTENKKALARRLLRNSFLFWKELRIIVFNELDGHSEDLCPYLYYIYLADRDGEKIASLEEVVLYDLFKFYTELFSLCFESNIDPTELCPQIAIEGFDEIIKKVIGITRVFERPNTQVPKYKQLGRTHRIAILKMLLKHMNVSKDIDKTNIAAFIEAVTGGNIEVKPKDSVSYKEPTKQAKEVAAGWLAKIGIKNN